MNRAIRDITDFIFISDTPIPADVIFIPGTCRHELYEKAALLYRQGFARYVLPSGKYSSRLGRFPAERIRRAAYSGEYETEWDYARHILMRNGVPAQFILEEKCSTNTYENASFSRRETDARAITVQTALICCKDFHARRALMTYALFYPETTFHILPAELPGFTAKDWFESDEGVRRVMGELERCGKYFADYYTESAKDKTVIF